MPLTARRVIALLCCAVVSNVMMIITVVPGTFGLWCPGWTCGPLVVLMTLAAIGAMILAPPSPGLQSLVRLAACMQITHLVNCDWFGPILGGLSLMLLSHPDVTAWFAGSWTGPQFATASEGEGTVDVRLSHLPFALILYLLAPTVEVNGDKHVLTWDQHRIPVPAGPATIRACVPLFGYPMMLAQTEITVAPTETVHLEYAAPLAYWIPATFQRRLPAAES